MKNRIIRCLAALSILCVMLFAAAPMASAYSNAYGVTQDKIRVRETSSTNSTIIDNIVKNGLVYITSSHSTGDKEFVKIKDFVLVIMYMFLFRKNLSIFYL